MSLAVELKYQGRGPCFYAKPTSRLPGGKANPTLPDGAQLQCFTDNSPGTAQEQYEEICSKLRQKVIDSLLTYPAILRVNRKGMIMLFNSTQEVKP